MKIREKQRPTQNKGVSLKIRETWQVWHSSSQSKDFKWIEYFVNETILIFSRKILYWEVTPLIFQLFSNTKHWVKHPLIINVAREYI